jgi:hypothetical protein
MFSSKNYLLSNLEYSDYTIIALVIHHFFIIGLQADYFTESVRYETIFN